MPYQPVSVTINPTDLISAVKSCDQISAEKLFEAVQAQSRYYRDSQIKRLGQMYLQANNAESISLYDLHQKHGNHLLDYLVSNFRNEAGLFYSIGAFKAALFAVNTDEDPDHEHRGICDQIDSRIDYENCYGSQAWILDKQGQPLFRIKSWLKTQFKLWPEFSGETRYPVPSLNPLNSAEEYFQYRADEDAMWKGEYGKSRKRLLKFLQEQFSKEFPENAE